MKKTTEKKTDGPTGPPMCKICETRHWSREAHKFAPTKKKKRDRDEN